MTPLSLFSPAKLNLFLAITGRRKDGFHDLVSIVAPLAWGDTLTVQPADRFTIECKDPAVPLDRSNLVIKAAEAFSAASGWKGGARFQLEKRIPIGAGLGGGSSNAAAALLGLNQIAGKPLDEAALAQIASRVGSDCPLFLLNAPVVMRGRGERTSLLPAPAASRLNGRAVIVFKPAFGISTAWAYGEMAKAAPASYLAPQAAEDRIARWIESEDTRLEQLLYNNMESVAFAKYPALPVLLQQLRSDFGLEPRMSGSGSACFALLDERSPVAEITRVIRLAWGESAIVVPSRFAINPH